MIEKFVRAESFEEALEVRARHGKDAFPVVGGTDMLVRIRAGHWKPRVILDLGQVPGLRGIHEEGDELVIGAATSAADCIGDPRIKHGFPALWKACAWLGGPQVQNAGSIGGNVATASPAGDTVPCLVAMGASVELRSTHGTRLIPVAEFATGPGRSVIAADELIRSVRVPKSRLGADPRALRDEAEAHAPKLHRFNGHVPFAEGEAPDHWQANDFFKAGARLAQVISIVSVAGYARLTGERTVSELRIAFGCAAPTIVLGHNVAKLVEGQELTHQLIEKAAVTVQDDIRPISDVRGSAEYKRALCANYVRLFLRDLAGLPLAGFAAPAEACSC